MGATPGGAVERLVGEVVVIVDAIVDDQGVSTLALESDGNLGAVAGATIESTNSL